MLSETGTIVALDGDAVWVETIRAGTCGSCAARSGCGHGLLASLGRSASVVRALRSPGGPDRLSLHDEVRISIPERNFLRGVTLLYLMPLLTMLGAALVASAWWVVPQMTQAQGDLRVTVAALAGLAAGLLGLRVLSRRHADDPSMHPVVTARLHARPAGA